MQLIFLGGGDLIPCVLHRPPFLDIFAVLVTRFSTTMNDDAKRGSLSVVRYMVESSSYACRRTLSETVEGPLEQQPQGKAGNHVSMSSDINQVGSASFIQNFLWSALISVVHP